MRRPLGLTTISPLVRDRSRYETFCCGAYVTSSALCDAPGGVIVTPHFRAPSDRFRLTRVVPTGLRYFFCQLMSTVMVLL